MSFRKNFTELDNQQSCNLNILNQGLKFKKNREGFTSFLDKDKERATKINSWTEWSNAQFGNSGTSSELNKSVGRYIYHTNLYSKQYEKLAHALKTCREKCNTDISPPNGQKSEACKAGCHLAFPEYSNKQNTFIQRMDTTGNKVGPTCGSVTDDMCKDGQVKMSPIPSEHKLNALGNDNFTTPITGCYKCGGGIWGRPIYRNPDGSIVNKCGGRNEDDCLKGKGWFDTSNILMKDSQLGPYVCPQCIDADGMQPDQDKTLTQRYSKMKESNEKMVNARGVVETNFDSMDIFIKKMSDGLSTKHGGTIGDLSSLHIKLSGYLDNLNKYDTYSGRLEDSLLKKESLVYKNWAFGILAISLFCVAISKIRKI